MTTTTPDDLWAPDLTTGFKPSTDLPHMQDTVQAALNRKPVNNRVGTDAGRITPVGWTPADGDTYYATDTDVEWRYDGPTSAWRVNTTGKFAVRPASAVGGTVQSDGSVVFTNATSVSLNGIFTSRFRQYEIRYYTTTKTLTSGISFRLRAAGVDDSSVNYAYRRSGEQGSGIASFSTTGDSFELDFNGWPVIIKSFNLLQPNAVAFTHAWGGQGMENNNSTGMLNMAGFGGSHRVSAAYDGLSLFVAAGSGTMTGGVSVIGSN